MFALVAQQRYIPERGPGHQAGSGKAAPSAGRTRAGGPGGKQTRVQELDELHVLLQQHILVQDAPHRVLAEHAVLRRQKKKRRRKESEKMKTSGEDRARSLARSPAYAPAPGPAYETQPPGGRDSISTEAPPASTAAHPAEQTQNTVVNLQGPHLDLQIQIFF